MGHTLGLMQDSTINSDMITCCFLAICVVCLLESTTFSCYERKELKHIRNQIRSEFYDLPQILRIVSKAGRIGLFGWRDLIVALPNLPLLTYRWARRKNQKNNNNI